jgi:beta-xylosidase
MTSPCPSSKDVLHSLHELQHPKYCMNLHFNERMLRIPVLQWLCLLGCLAWSASAADLSAPRPQTPPGTFLNPIGDPPLKLQDPFVLTEGKKYYLFGATAQEDGFQCYESSDLASWKLDGWAWRRSGIRVAIGALRAPQVFPYEGMFCLVYSAWTPRGTKLALAASTRPEGPYHDLHVPWLDLGDSCTSSHVFFDSKGKPFLAYSARTNAVGCVSSAIFGVALAKDLSKTIGAPVKLLDVNQRWELARRNAFRVNDSPRVFRGNGRYFMLYSANEPGSIERAVGYATSEKPLGPWTKGAENPLLASRTNIGLVGPESCSAFPLLDRSEWFVVYNSGVETNNPSANRVVNLDRLSLLTNYRLAVNGPTRSPQRVPNAAR